MIFRVCNMETAMDRVHPVILTGGSGTRLWPASRKAYPKQFAPLIGDNSLYQEPLKRFSGSYKQCGGRT